MHPLYRHTWDSAALLAAHPPRFTHANKRAVYDIASAGPAPRGTVTVWRYAELDDLPALDATPTFEDVPGFFTYDVVPGELHWHQNFADPELFGYYAGRLLAQDELQVAEHPALGSVREALLAKGLAPRTAEAGRSTPVLVAGVERRVAIDTEPDLAPGRYQGLYGNRFAEATPTVARSATRALLPPTVTNIVALAAPAGGHGAYTLADIHAVLHTAATGYRAVALASAELGSNARVVVHTGFWGCGAFGGDRVLMVALQAVAARLAGVVLVVHTGDRTGGEPVIEARQLLAGLELGSAASVCEELLAHGFRWGVSDGN